MNFGASFDNTQIAKRVGTLINPNENNRKLTSKQISNRLAILCKPPGSLGVLESIAERLCQIQQTLAPVTKPRHVAIFAADHGVVAEGVSAWPSSVTRAVVNLMPSQRTASGVFARELDCTYEVIDVGLNRAINIEPNNPEPMALATGLDSTTIGPITPEASAYGSGQIPYSTRSSTRDSAQLIHAAKRDGTANLLHKPAMQAEDFDHAWSVGKDRAFEAINAGNKLLIGGEMGIGNTTSASCLVALLTDSDPEVVVGRGAGIDDEGLARKKHVVANAVQRVRLLGKCSPKQIACEVGGLEIVALAGYYAEGATRGATLVLDGFIATAAALVAESIAPGTSRSMIAGHRSVEPGHAIALASLDLNPVLDLQMRLGEATGALASLPLIDLAAAMIREMATLDELKLE